MPTLILRFPGRRYHATPWGHHVNEGLIEWPPSPWRILRALLSTGYTALGWAGGTTLPMQSAPPEGANCLIEKLASVLPCYRLPRAAGAHTRHYMPLGTIEKGRERTTLVFDTWAQVDEGELAVIWDVELTPAELALLSDLALNLGYLGRSESWVDARVAEPSEPLPHGSECQPCGDRPQTAPGWDQVSLLAAVSPPEYAQWRGDVVAGALAPFPLPDKAPSQKLLAARTKAEAPYPADLIACLQADTSWLREHGWSQPPGSRRVLYWRSCDALESGAPRPRPRVSRPQPVEAMLLAVATASGNDHALPSVTRTLPQAELLHRALVQTASSHRQHSAVLSGCDEAGRPLKARHKHAHLLPLDLDGDGHIEHILIWAPMGLDVNAQRAIRAVRRTFTKGGVGALKLALVGMGDLGSLGGLSAPWGPGMRALLGPSKGALEWVSVTPFVAPRFLKSSGKNCIEGQVQDDLHSRGLPELIKMTVVPPGESPAAARFRHFVRQRRSGPQSPVDCGFFIRLTLAAPAKGPITLGYGSHFGLGLFAAVPASSG